MEPLTYEVTEWNRFSVTHTQMTFIQNLESGMTFRYLNIKHMVLLDKKMLMCLGSMELSCQTVPCNRETPSCDTAKGAQNCHSDLHKKKLEELESWDLSA